MAFLGNRAVSRGGAISADANCNFQCNHCIFDSNSYTYIIYNIQLGQAILHQELY